MVVMQNLISLSEPSLTDLADDYVRQNKRTLRRTSDLLRPDTISSLLSKFIADSSVSGGLIHFNIPSLRRVQGFRVLSQYLLVLETHLTEYSKWGKAMYKLTFVRASTLKAIAEKGFCKPQETDDSGKVEQDAGEKLEGGTGLGSGQGQENVSEQIEDASHVEGLKGDDENEQPRDKDETQEGDDKAIEMGNDFEGDLEDKEEGGEEDQENDEGEEEEHDDQVGGLDPLDPDAADEKLWNDEKESDEKKECEDQGDNRPADQTQGDSEMTAREDQKPKDGEKGEEGEQQEKMEADETAEQSQFIHGSRLPGMER